MSALTPLTFTFLHDPNFWLLDNIAVNDPVPAGVPELDGALAGAPLALLSMSLLLAGDGRRKSTTLASSRKALGNEP